MGNRRLFFSICIKRETRACVCVFAAFLLRHPHPCAPPTPPTLPCSDCFSGAFVHTCALAAGRGVHGRLAYTSAHPHHPRPHKHTEQYDKQKNASVAHGKSRHEGLSEGSSGGGEEAARVSAGSSPSRERLTVLVKMLFTIKIHFFAFPLGF